MPLFDIFITVYSYPTKFLSPSDIYRNHKGPQPFLQINKLFVLPPACSFSHRSHSSLMPAIAIASLVHSHSAQHWLTHPSCGIYLCKLTCLINLFIRVQKPGAEAPELCLVDAASASLLLHGTSCCHTLKYSGPRMGQCLRGFYPHEIRNIFAFQEKLVSSSTFLFPRRQKVAFVQHISARFTSTRSYVSKSFHYIGQLYFHSIITQTSHFPYKR